MQHQEKQKINYQRQFLNNLARNKLQQCQIRLRDYLDEHKNGVKTIESTEDFKNALLPMAELSTDLFVEAELLKMWSDFFGSDIPYFVLTNNSLKQKPLK